MPDLGILEGLLLPKLHDRGPQQRLRQGRHQSGDAGVGGGLPGGDGRVRGHGHDGRLVRPPGRGPAPEGDPDRGQGLGREGQDGQAGEEEGREGAGQGHTRDSLQALSKLGELVDGRYRIVSQPPIVVPARDLGAVYGLSGDEIERAVRKEFRAYRATLRDDQRHLLERFEILDVARKVVGVGSVGTRAFIVLLQGRDQQDPLFLQVKEATASVLEGHLPRSRQRQHGERVVYGQRML
jgi:hypothetical protein